MTKAKTYCQTELTQPLPESRRMKSAEELRPAFEHWASNEGAWLNAVERNEVGEYKLMTTSLQWNAWKAAYNSMMVDALASRVPDGWQPIETAPKDQWIIVACSNAKSSTTARWDKYTNIWKTLVGEASSNCFDVWLPLPQPPKG